ncbi:hypothetical protein B0H12DRAFT_1076628 [Mycena haematopus]|nr:hypothetical protein B0H12DRAFT_1076628 [Mycena haematopus]
MPKKAQMKLVARVWQRNIGSGDLCKEFRLVWVQICAVPEVTWLSNRVNTGRDGMVVVKVQNHRGVTRGHGNGMPMSKRRNAKFNLDHPAYRNGITSESLLRIGVESPLEAILQFGEHEEAWVKGFQNQLESAKSVQKWAQKMCFQLGRCQGSIHLAWASGMSQKNFSRLRRAMGHPIGTGPWDIP